MVTKVCSRSQLQRIEYEAIPNTNRADVRLRRNIREIRIDENGDKFFQADEVHFRAVITLEEVKANFDKLYMNGGPIEHEDQ